MLNCISLIYAPFTSANGAPESARSGPIASPAGGRSSGDKVVSARNRGNNEGKNFLELVEDRGSTHEQRLSADSSMHLSVQDPRAINASEDCV